MAHCHNALSRFRVARLVGAQLLKSTFDGADLTDAVLLDALARRASFVEANLQRADLSGMDLFRAYLAEVDLRSARLRGANLEQAFLDGAKLYGADLAGARGLETARADWIDISPDGQSNTLRGDDARAWLLRAAGRSG